MKILFLDIDGCVVTFKSAHIIHSIGDKKYTAFEKNAVANLNIILKETDAKIVISSHWRRFYTLAELRSIFIKEGVDIGPKGQRVIGTTATLSENMDKGSQIETWLEDHSKVENYVVLDDRVRDIEDYVDDFVHIKHGWTEQGVTEKDADEAIEILED